MKLAIILLTALQLPSWAQAQVLNEGFAFNIGTYQANMLDLAGNASGKADFFGETYLPLGIQYTTTFGMEWRFVPALNFTHLTAALIPNETPEKGAEKNLIFLNFPFVKNLKPWMDGKIGFGVLRYEIKGKGGTVELNNGGGTATFYKPSENRAAHSTYLLLGAAFPMTNWQLDVDLQINGALSEAGPAYSLYLYLTKPFPTTY